jgi:DNA-binding YbaB/EbfC family protein
MNIARLMQQAQAAQAQMQKALEQLEVEGSAGGGLVKVRLSGLKELRGITIDPQAVTGDAAGMLEDLVMAAWEEASRLLEERSQGILKGMGMPPGFPGMR